MHGRQSRETRSGHPSIVNQLRAMKESRHINVTPGLLAFCKTQFSAALDDRGFFFSMHIWPHFQGDTRARTFSLELITQEIPNT